MTVARHVSAEGSTCPQAVALSEHRDANVGARPADPQSPGSHHVKEVLTMVRMGTPIGVRRVSNYLMRRMQLRRWLWG